MTNNSYVKEHRERLLSRKEVAELLGCKESTLAVWACNKRYDLPFVKVGRLAKYRGSDVDAFISARTCNQNGGCVSYDN